MAEDFGAVEDFGIASGVEDFGAVEDFGEAPEEEVKSAKGDIGESFKRASGEVVQAVDMILGLPGFAAKVGATGLMDIVYSIAGDENPAAKSSEIINKLAETQLGKYALTPTQQLLSDMGVENIAKGTVVEELMGKVGEGIESAAQFTSDDPNRQAIVRQLADTAMLGFGSVAARVGKKTVSPKEAPKTAADADLLARLDTPEAAEAKVFTTDPADMFPETLKTPYGTKTGEAPAWTVDEFGIPVNRGRTENLQRTEMAPIQEAFSRQGEFDRLGGEAPLLNLRPEETGGRFVPSRDFELEPLVEQRAKELMDLPYEKVTPEELRTTQGELFSPEMESVPYKSFATPEQGIEHIQRIPTDITQPRGEPAQLPIPGSTIRGGTGKKGFGQGGAVNPDILTEGLKKIRKALGDSGRAYKDETGTGVVLFRGGHSEGYNKLEPREGYSVFTTDNPYLASTFAGSSVTPVVLKPDANVRTFQPVRFSDGSINSGASMFKFDKEAAALGKGEVLVWKNSYDVGPEASMATDPARKYSYASDQYAFNDSAVVQHLSDATKGLPLGQTGFGKKQGGSIEPGVFKEGVKKLLGVKKDSLVDIARSNSKERFVQEFKQRYPDRAAQAEKAWDLASKDVQVAATGKKGSQFLNDTDYALGLISTRLGNLHPALERAAKVSEQSRMQGIAKDLETADVFLTDLNKLDNAAPINKALLDNNFGEVKKYLSPEGMKEFENVTASLRRIGKDLYDRKIIGNIRKDYWPRVVSDYEGLLNALGTERKPLHDFVEAEKQKYAARGEFFDEMAMAQTVDKFMRQYYPARGGAPYAKQRAFDAIPEGLEQFYASPTQSLHSYIRWSHDKIAEHDFFGRDIRKDAEGRIDLPASINEYIGDKLATGKLNEAQIEEARKILQARFGAGNAIPSSKVQTFKDINNLALLTDYTTTAGQLLDMAPSVRMNGLVPTVQSLVMQLAGKNKEDVRQVAGIMDHFAEEFVGNRRTSDWVTSAFRKTGFTQLGKFSQNVVTNAARIARQKDAVLGKPNSRLYREYSEYFGDSFPQLVDDLKNGRKTLLTDELLFSELSRASPISKLEKTEWHLRHPNAGGLFFSLKSFMLKQADFNRREVYNNFKKGNIAEGTKALAVLTATYAASDMAYQDLKDFWANRPVSERTAWQIALSNLRMMGLDKHFSDKLMNGEVGSALTDAVLPPVRHYDVVGRDVAGAVRKGKEAIIGEDPLNPAKGPTGESLTVLPFGDLIYGRFTEAGQKRRERLENEAENEKLKEMMQ